MLRDYVRWNACAMLHVERAMRVGMRAMLHVERAMRERACELGREFRVPETN